METKKIAKERGIIRKDRICAKFTSGNEDEKTLMFERFCNGRLYQKLKGSGVFIFEIDRVNVKTLNKLIDDANKLDYVESAATDIQNELIEPVTKTE